MINEIISKKSKLWKTEEELKDKVYATFEAELDKKKSAVIKSKKYVASGQYEDQAAFISHITKSKRMEELNEVEYIIGCLYSKPYFSHIRVLSEGKYEEYFLSDNEHLEEIIPIGENEVLLPFKQDPDRPLFSQIFHCYQARDGEAFADRLGNKIEPKLICDDEIMNGKLISVMLIYSEDGDTSENIDFDELLIKKLEENRENPMLRNIISTLQLNQFEIIQEDINQDFVVQGCAGSGKSQILLHRLFFLRDMLSESNWESVLLITPTELFRTYSSELIRRYGLASIANVSIVGLYKSVLETIDKNFKNRNYKFELTEEYLPDEYLQEVYADECIKGIDSEIRATIKEYIKEACNLLDCKMPSSYSKRYISDLIEKLDIKIIELKQKERTDDSEKDDNKEILQRCSKVNYHLKRIETTVFEQAVWKTLAPIKEKYSIEVIENSNENRKKRILYKSDLLFYLRVYLQLGFARDSQNYKLLCIDEGQDLHAIDYATLKALYPNAKFNIFGDVSQELHMGCGVKNWEEDTQVKKLYVLDKNYRNTAAIVNFCNNKFDVTMDYLGNPSSDFAPVTVRSKEKLYSTVSNEGVVVIVKSREMFYKFCEEAGFFEYEFEFLDTNATEAETTKFKCYSIYAAKGLEFSKVLVYSKGMNENQQMVACTRAMERLYYYE